MDDWGCPSIGARDRKHVRTVDVDLYRIIKQRSVGIVVVAGDAKVIRVLELALELSSRCGQAREGPSVSSRADCCRVWGNSEQLTRPKVSVVSIRQPYPEDSLHFP